MILIRNDMVKDLDEINELTLEMHSHLGKLVGIEFSEKDLKAEMYESEEELENVYVAEIDGDVVGYIAFSDEVEEDEWYGRHYNLHHMVVKKEFRGMGIGSKLFNRLCKVLG